MRIRLGLGVALTGVGVSLALACSALVESELTRVNCSWEGFIGPPACPVGQACRAGVCSPCNAHEICGDGLDNDCNGAPEDGCLDGGGGAAGGGGGLGGDAGSGGSAPGGSGGASGAGGATGGGGTSSGGGGVSGGGTGGSSGTGASGGTGGTTAGSIGSPCASHAECSSGLFCESPSVFGAASSAKVCTRSCCKSEECGSGSNVCYPAYYGGSACVPGSSVGRAETGTAPAGDPCTKNADCRSGLCSANKCFDACCVDSNCPGAQYCVKTTLPGTTQPVMACGKNPGNQGFQAFCDQGSDCQSNMCLTVGACTKSCCTSKDCAGTVSLSCIHSGGLRYCGSYTGGTKAVGETCTSSSECKSGKCIAGGGYCSDTCCSNSDCGTGFACRAASLGGMNQLLCVKL